LKGGGKCEPIRAGISIQYRERGRLTGTSGSHAAGRKREGDSPCTGEVLPRRRLQTRRKTGTTVGRLVPFTGEEGRERKEKQAPREKVTQKTIRRKRNKKISNAGHGL